MFTKGHKVIVLGMEDSNERRDVPATYISDTRTSGIHAVDIDGVRLLVEYDKLMDAQDYYDSRNKDSTEPAYVGGMTIGEAIRKRRGWDNE